jgi:hypothetical protein
MCICISSGYQTFWLAANGRNLIFFVENTDLLKFKLQYNLWISQKKISDFLEKISVLSETCFENYAIALFEMMLRGKLSCIILIQYRFFNGTPKCRGTKFDDHWFRRWVVFFWGGVWKLEGLFRICFVIYFWCIPIQVRLC